MEISVEEKLSPRQAINKYCRDYAELHTEVGFKGVFDNLYEEFKKRSGIDLVKETAERKCKNKLECAELLEKATELEALAKEMYEIKAEVTNDNPQQNQV